MGRGVMLVVLRVGEMVPEGAWHGSEVGTMSMVAMVVFKCKTIAILGSGVDEYLSWKRNGKEKREARRKINTDGVNLGVYHRRKLVALGGILMMLAEESLELFSFQNEV